MSTGSQRNLNLTNNLKEIRFRQWPLCQQPWQSLLLLLAAAAAAVLVARALENAWSGVAVCVVLVVVLWRLWLPVDFEFGPRGVVQNYIGRQRRVAWRDIARCEFQKRGLLLYASDDRSAIGALRSIYVRYPAQREQLCELVQFELSRWSARTASTSSVETVRRRTLPESDGISNSSS